MVWFLISSASFKGITFTTLKSLEGKSSFDAISCKCSSERCRASIDVKNMYGIRTSQESFGTPTSLASEFTRMRQLHNHGANVRYRGRTYHAGGLSTSQNFYYQYQLTTLLLLLLLLLLLVYSSLKKNQVEQISNLEASADLFNFSINHIVIFHIELWQKGAKEMRLQNEKMK